VFEHFEGNYSWNLATIMVLNRGGVLTEVDDVLKPLESRAANEDDAATDAFFDAWRTAGDKVAKAAEADEEVGNRRGAAAKYKRAATYYFAAERQSSLKHPSRNDLYQSFLSIRSQSIWPTVGNAIERVEIPSEGTTLPALFVRGKGQGDRKPCMVDGLDANKEYIYLGGMPTELAERHINTDRGPSWRRGGASAAEPHHDRRDRPPASAADRMTLHGSWTASDVRFSSCMAATDRQVPVEFAHRTFAEAVNSVNKTLHIHTVEEGGSEHCSVDNRELTVSYMAHWTAQTLSAPKELA
jgi:hypothetical protein